MRLIKFLSKIPKKNKSLLLILIAITLHLFAFPIYAQNPFFEATPEEFQIALQECADTGNCGLEATVQAIVTDIGNAISFGGGGELDSSRRPGALYFASGMIGTLLAERPISSGDYIQYLAQRLNPARPAYAQSTGYRALAPVIRIWTALRNVAYLAFVIIFIFVGFMIMFRARLDPQTVVNIQNSLPKLVVTLLLITFSFAIAGFMVDLIYLGIFLIISVFASQGLIENPDETRQALLGYNLFSIVASGGLWRGGTDTIADAIQGVIKSAIENNVILDTLFGGGLGNWLAHTIIIVAILFSMFKLFFQLLIAYVNIIISTLFAPIMILFNALPGSQSFGNWVRNFMANVLIFPAVAMIFITAAVLMGPPEGGITWGITTSEFEQQYGPDEGWLPPFIGTTTDTQAVLSLIGFGFILFAPQVVGLIQQAIKAKPLPTAGVFAPIMAGARVVTAPIRAPVSAATGLARTFIHEKVERTAWGGGRGGGGGKN